MPRGSLPARGAVPGRVRSELQLEPVTSDRDLGYTHARTELARVVPDAIPERQALLFDVRAPTSHDFRKALDVLSRRVTARDVKSDTRGRG